MSERKKFGLYIVGIFFLSLLRDPLWLITVSFLMLGVLFDRSILRRVFFSYLLFGFVLTLLYLIFKGMQPFLLSFNLRLFCMLYLSMWAVKHIDMIQVLPKRLAMLFVLALSMVSRYKRSFEEFWMGVASRWPHFSYRFWSEGLKRFFLLFTSKALYDARQMEYGLKSRGVLDD